MKSIPNKQTELPLADTKDKATYADLLKVILSVQPGGGFSITDIRSRLRIIEILERSKETIELEDADYTYVLNLVNNMKWSIMSKDILEFTENFEKLK